MRLKASFSHMFLKNIFSKTNVGLGTGQRRADSNVFPHAQMTDYCSHRHSTRMRSSQWLEEGEGNLESILSTSSRFRSWFSRLILSFMTTSWLIRVFCISLSWLINLCRRASSCACMAASISRSWATVAVTREETWSITVARLFRDGTVYAANKTQRRIGLGSAAKAQLLFTFTTSYFNFIYYMTRWWFTFPFQNQFCLVSSFLWLKQKKKEF